MCYGVSRISHQLSSQEVVRSFRARKRSGAIVLKYRLVAFPGVGDLDSINPIVDILTRSRILKRWMSLPLHWVAQDSRSRERMCMLKHVYAEHSSNCVLVHELIRERMYVYAGCLHRAAARRSSRPLLPAFDYHPPLPVGRRRDRRGTSPSCASMVCSGLAAWRVDGLLGARAPRRARSAAHPAGCPQVSRVPTFATISVVISTGANGNIGHTAPGPAWKLGRASGGCRWVSLRLR